MAHAVRAWLARRFDPARPSGACLTLGLGGAAAFTVAFVAIAEDVIEPLGSAGMDPAAAAFATGIASPALTRVMWVATLLGDTWLLAVLASLLLLAWGHPRRAVVLAGMSAAAPALSETLKGVFDRARPPASAALIGLPESASFPSGHAIGSLVFLGMLAVMLVASAASRRVKVAGVAGAVVMALLVGLSRVYLGVHWFSDVLASWMLGCALLCAGGAGLLAWETADPRAPAFPVLGKPLRAALAASAAVAEVIAVVLQSGRNPLL